MFNRNLLHKSLASAVLGALISITLPIASADAAPTVTTSGSLKTYKFEATIDSALRDTCSSIAGSSGCSMGTRTINVNDQTIEYWYSCGYCDMYSNSQGTRGLYYFDDIKLGLGNITANQIVSSKMNLVPQTTASGTRTWNFNYGSITNIWTEDAPEGARFGGGGGNYSFTSVSAGTPISLDTTQMTRDVLNGTPNYGVYVSFNGASPSTLYFWTSEATDPNLRPTFEVVVDTSRPRFAAPTSGPTGMTLTPSTSSITSSWSGVPANVDSVTVEFNCSISGNTSTKVSSTARSATRNGLQAGERCSTRALTTNDGGSSPMTMSTSEVTVLGNAPTTSPTTTLTLSALSGYVLFSNVDSNATEVVVTLVCSSSGTRSQTVANGTMQVIFRDVREGESCYAYSTAKNQWGASSAGQSTASAILRGSPPVPPAIKSTSTQEGRIDITWDSVPAGATQVDLVIRCEKSGSLTKTFTPTVLAGFFIGLSPGDVCNVTATSSNSWGTSTSYSINSGIKVFAKAPNAPTVSNIDNSVAGKVTFNFSAPSTATYVDLNLECVSSGLRTMSGIPANSGRYTVSNLEFGESCSASLTAISSTGQKSAPYQFSFDTTGNIPSQPTGIELIPLVNRVNVIWQNMTSDSWLAVRLICSKSGEQYNEIYKSQPTASFTAIAGENCYVLATENNDWGTSPVTRTSSVIIRGATSTPSPRPSPSATKSQSTSSPTATPVTRTKSPAPIPTKKATATPTVKLQLVVTCVKGSLTKVLTTTAPKCPTGWKVKTVIPVQ